MNNLNNSWLVVVGWGFGCLFLLRVIDWLDGASRKMERERQRQLDAEAEGWRKWASTKGNLNSKTR